MGSAVTPDLSKGGTIDGDLTIGSNSDLVVTGDFKVEGAGSFAYDEIIEGTLQITGSNAYIDVLDTDSSLKVSIRGGDSIGAIGTYSNHPLSIRTNSTERIHLTSAGLVGIGGTPSTQLDVRSSAETVMQIKNSGSSRAKLVLDSGANIAELWFAVSGTAKTAFYQKADGNSLGVWFFC